MKKNLKLGAITGFIVIGGFFLFSNSVQANLTSREIASAGTPVSPRTLYVQNCARCHGSNGKSQTSLGKKLEADDLTGSEAKGLSSAKTIRVITNGRNKMPVFGRKLTAAQIKSIASYIKSL